MPARKSPDRRQGRGTADVGQLASVSPIGAAVPDPPHPKGGQLLPEVVEAWDAYWSDELSGLVKPGDMPALRRLFAMYDTRERMERIFRAEPMTEGSTGQLVVNPAAKEVASLDGRILPLEDRFGLSPSGRLKLGITFGLAARSLEDINRAFNDDDSEDDDEDPRIRAIDTTAT